MGEMPKVTDTRDRMINGAKELIRKNGYGATSFKDVWEYTDTPRGSVYFHFPDGKEELGLEVLSAVGTRLVDLSHAVGARTRTPETFIRGMARAIADEVEDSGFMDGCAIVNIAAETAAGSPVLREASAAAFSAWADAMAEELERKGVRRQLAVRTAELLVSSIEGARVLAKTYRDRGPLDHVGDYLASLAPEANDTDR
jgi:TetR/AcrR family transcriptional regulator, lmrAB and yxaGH operons repressor